MKRPTVEEPLARVELVLSLVAKGMEAANLPGVSPEQPVGETLTEELWWRFGAVKDGAGPLAR